MDGEIVMLSDLLEKSGTAILARWQQLIMQSYPPDTSGFLAQEKDRFLNPVGYTLYLETEALFRLLAEGAEESRLADPMDNIVKIRAVQEFSPSEAVGFVFLLKRAVREVLGDAARGPELLDEMAGFESRIDRLALQAFDLYMERREKIFQIRARELRERSGILLDRINRIYGPLDGDPEGPDLGSSDVMRGGA
jgi:hypothetical protein